jgi:hypothetical protein
MSNTVMAECTRYHWICNEHVKNKSNIHSLKFSVEILIVIPTKVRRFRIDHVS